MSGGVQFELAIKKIRTRGPGNSRLYVNRYISLCLSGISTTSLFSNSAASGWSEGMLVHVRLGEKKRERTVKVK